MGIASLRETGSRFRDVGTSVPACSRGSLAASLRCITTGAMWVCSTSSWMGSTVGFPNVDPIHEEVEHTHIAPVVIHLKLAASEPREQAGTDVPTSLKREPVSLRDAIPMIGRLAIDRLHQQQFEIIGRS